MNTKLLLIISSFSIFSSCIKCKDCYIVEKDNSGTVVGEYDVGKKCGKDLERYDDVELEASDGSAHSYCN